VTDGLRLERLLPVACFGGAALLAASQFMTMFELNDALGFTQKVVEGPDQHWYAMVILGGFAIAAVLGAISAGSKPLAASVAVSGVVALLLFLLIDLPDAGKAGDIESATESLVIVEAHPVGGFWLELIGALILAVCGGALSTLTSEQLSSLRPGSRPPAAPRDRRGRRGAPIERWPREGEAESDPGAAARGPEAPSPEPAASQRAGRRGSDPARQPWP
jgi:hypothetical protein